MRELVTNILGNIAINNSVWAILIIICAVLVIVGIIKKIAKKILSLFVILFACVIILNCGRAYIKDNVGIDIGDKEISMEVKGNTYSIDIKDIKKIVIQKDKLKNLATSSPNQTIYEVVVKSKIGNFEFNVYNKLEAFAIECIASSKGIKVVRK